MYEFKKTDAKELERTIAVLVAVVMVAMPVGYLLQFFDIIVSSRVSVCNMVLTTGAMLLVMFDIFYLVKCEEKRFSVFDLAILGMLIALILSTVMADDISMALSGRDMTEEGAFVLAAYIVMAFSASLVSDDKYRKIIYGASVVLGIIEVSVAFMQTIVVIPAYDQKMFLEDGYRAFGTAKNPNPFGSLMVLLAGLECGLLYNSDTIKKKVFHTILALLYTYCIFLSGTRGAMLGFFAAALILSMLLIVKGKKEKRVKQVFAKLGMVVCIVILVLGVYILGSKNEWSDVISRTTNEISNSKMGEERLTIWKGCFENYFLKNPIFGCGPANMSFTFTGGNIFNEDYSIELVSDSHNKYLTVMDNQGIVGIIAYLFLLIYCFQMALKKVFNYDKTIGQEYLGLLFAFVGFAVADIFCIGMVNVVPYFYIVIGMMTQRKDSKTLFGKK